MDHYRCVTCYFPRTRTTRTCEKVTFSPHEIPFPQATLQDHLNQATENIVTLLTQPPSSTVPSISAGDPVRNALLEISEQLQRVEKLPEVAPLDNQLPRVSPRKDVQPPRVVEPTPTPLSTLLQHNNLPKKAIFRSTTDHSYPLH